jgi:two-component system, LytTR family, sensor histidine kinase AlgZ
MTAAWGIRRLCASHWFRVSAVTLAAALVMTALFALIGSPSVRVTFENAVVHSLSMGGLAALVLPWVRHPVRRAGKATQWAVLVGALVGVGVLGTTFSCSLLTVLNAPVHPRFGGCFAGSVWINVLLTATIGIAMILYERQRERLDALTLELRTRELEHERARKMALEARLASLEARLHPHFLFNTLNAISCLIQEDPDRAERTVERLASLLRFSLDAAERGLVPLAREIDIVSAYLEIEKTRLGERLSHALDVSPDVQACEVPPLSVQTLVENSIKHAIAPRRTGGRVRVEASALGDDLVLSVWDDGPGFTPAAIRPGHGLDNLQGRLAGRFGDAASLTITRRDGGTLVSVSLPRARPGAPRARPGAPRAQVPMP